MLSNSPNNQPSTTLQTVASSSSAAAAASSSSAASSSNEAQATSTSNRINNECLEKIQKDQKLLQSKYKDLTNLKESKGYKKLLQSQQEDDDNLEKSKEYKEIKRKIEEYIELLHTHWTTIINYLWKPIWNDKTKSLIEKEIKLLDLSYLDKIKEIIIEDYKKITSYIPKIPFLSTEDKRRFISRVRTPYFGLDEQLYTIQSQCIEDIKKIATKDYVKNFMPDKYETKGSYQRYRTNERFSTKSTKKKPSHAVEENLFLAPVYKLNKGKDSVDLNKHFAVFTSMDIKEGTIIFADVETQSKADKKQHDNSMMNDDDKESTNQDEFCNLAPFVNHSFNANCKLDGKNIIATKKIKANQLLLIDPKPTDSDETHLNPDDNWESPTDIFEKKAKLYSLMKITDTNNKLCTFLELQGKYKIYFPDIKNNPSMADKIIIFTDNNEKVLPDQPRITPLMAACITGDLEKIKELVPITTPGYQCANGKTAFHYLYSSSFIDDDDCQSMIKLWFEKKPEVIKDLISTIHKTTFKSIFEKPAALRKNSNIEIINQVYEILELKQPQKNPSIIELSWLIKQKYNELDSLVEKRLSRQPAASSSSSSSNDKDEKNDSAEKNLNGKNKRKSNSSNEPKKQFKKIKHEKPPAAASIDPDTTSSDSDEDNADDSTKKKNPPKKPAEIIQLRKELTAMQNAHEQQKLQIAQLKSKLADAKTINKDDKLIIAQQGQQIITLEKDNQRKATAIVELKQELTIERDKNEKSQSESAKLQQELDVEKQANKQNLTEIGQIRTQLAAKDFAITARKISIENQLTDTRNPNSCSTSQIIALQQELERIKQVNIDFKAESAQTNAPLMAAVVDLQPNNLLAAANTNPSSSSSSSSAGTEYTDPAFPSTLPSATLTSSSSFGTKARLANYDPKHFSSSSAASSANSSSVENDDLPPYTPMT